MKIFLLIGLALMVSLTGCGGGDSGPDYDLSMFGFFPDDSRSISTLLANFA